MRIIKENNAEKKHKCKYCKSVFAYTQEEVDRVWFNFVTCPVCKNHVSVSKFDKKVKK